MNKNKKNKILQYIFTIIGLVIFFMGFTYSYIFKNDIYEIIFAAIGVTIIIISLSIFKSKEEIFIEKSLKPFLFNKYPNGTFEKDSMQIGKGNKKISNFTRFNILPSGKNIDEKEYYICNYFKSNDFELFTLLLSGNSKTHESKILFSGPVVNFNVNIEDNFRILSQKHIQNYEAVKEIDNKINYKIHDKDFIKIYADEKDKTAGKLLPLLRKIQENFDDFGMIIEDDKCSICFYEYDEIFLDLEQVEILMNIINDFKLF